MQFIDMHCDSLWTLFMEDGNLADLNHSQVTHVDFTRMKKAGQMAQFFAVCLIPEEYENDLGVPSIPSVYYIRLLREYLKRNVAEHGNVIAMAYNAADVQKNWADGKMSAVLTMEDGTAVDGELDNLKIYYDMGYRALTLTWNFYNCFGAPNSKEEAVMKDGLTDFGKEAVQYMQELGMLVDVSHLSEGGFYDVAEVCRKPFVATHSNSMALSPHQRNLTDEQIRMLGRTGSVTGLNFEPQFLNADITNMYSSAEVLAKHARHIVDVGGMECLGIGTDLDGTEGTLEIDDCSKMWLLEDALRKEAFTTSEIEKIFYKNVLRVMGEAMK